MAINDKEMDKSDWIAVGVAIGLTFIIILSFSGFADLIWNYDEEIVIECNYWIECLTLPSSTATNIGVSIVTPPSSNVFLQGTATNIGYRSLLVSIDMMLMTSLGHSYETCIDFGLIEPSERQRFLVYWHVSSGADDYTLEYKVDVTARAF